jgi:hypothetical protein
LGNIFGPFQLQKQVYRLTTMKFQSSILLLMVWGGSAFQVQQPQGGLSALKESMARQAAAVCVGCLLFCPPAMAIDTTVAGSLQQAIVEASDATYPVLKSLTSETVSPLANKIANLLTKKVSPERLSMALDSAANALLAIPDEKLDQFTQTVKASYEGVSASSCSAIPLPMDAITTFASSDAVKQVDSETLSRAIQKISALRQSIPSSDSSLCLPASPQGLEQIWVGQTELALTIPKGVKQELAGKAATAIKSIPSAELLRVFPDAKKVLGNVDRKVASKFQQTSVNLDKAIQKDGRFQAFSAI